MSISSYHRVAITGAAGGLGKAMALEFASKGYKVAVADLNQPAGEQVVEEIAEAGGEAFFAPCNVCEEADIDALLKECHSRWDGVDVLINNAGIASHGAIHKESLSSWQRLMDINALGVVRGCKTFVPAMKSQGGGHIVNIASIAGITCTPMMAAYNASKAAVIALSETLRWELKKSQIGVTVVCPSLFKTGLVNSSGMNESAAASGISKMMEASSLSAQDIAALVYHAVEKNQFMLLPHKETHKLWWLKRLSPDLYQWLFAKLGR